MSDSSENGLYQKHYKKLLILTAIVLIFCVLYLYNFYPENKDIIYKDVSLTGGTSITVFDKSVDIEELERALSPRFPDLDVRKISNLRTGEQEAFIIETSSEVDSARLALENFLGYTLNTENSSVQFTGASISRGFYEQLRLTLLIAFIFMGIAVFVIFRTPVPSIAVIFSAFSGIIMTIVTVDILGIRLSTGGIAALLMLIGYSVDTDILLTARVLRSKSGPLNKRLAGALKTGLTMTITSIAAVLVALIISYSFSDVLRQVFTVLLIGLIFDIFNTWVTNASMLKWYAEAKKIE